MNGILNTKFKRLQAIQLPPKKIILTFDVYCILIGKKITHRDEFTNFFFRIHIYQRNIAERGIQSCSLTPGFVLTSMTERFMNTSGPTGAERPGSGWAGIFPVSYKEELGWFFYPQYPQNHRVVWGELHDKQMFFCFFLLIVDLICRGTWSWMGVHLIKLMWSWHEQNWLVDLIKSN